MPDRFYFWFMPWEPSVTVTVAIVAAALCYLRGCRSISPSFLRQCCFWIGLALLYIVLHTGFDYYAEHEFFMHRIQHTVLHHIAPFLMALSTPWATLVAGLPLAWQPKKPWPVLHNLYAAVNHPVMAATLFCGLILFWLIPPIHFIAMLDWRLYRLMNWGMAINGLMFWNLVLNSHSLSAGKRIAMMIAIIPPQIAMGLVIFAAPYELYPLYSLCGRAFQLSPLVDQQLGGMVLWISAAMMSFTGALLVMWREWTQQADPLPAPGAMN